ncbi:zinc finger protein 862-like [Clavelina lepadiformis]|uniref:zinc finger protein 862-like n=1 Tax=Clavelina lepadiformis TaxID=159417 RepID=UPI00404135A8
MSERKNVFRDDYQDYEREFKGIKRSLKGECFAHCNICNCDINLEAIGKTAISTHTDTEKHKKCVIMINSSQSMNNFFTSRSAPTTTDYKAAAAEGTWAFHTVKHQQSFLTNDCTSRLFKAIFPDSNIAKKFASARTKTTSIVTGVFVPYAQKMFLSELGVQPFSISVDASNHNEVKLFPLVIRFFNAKVGVRVRLLDLRSMPGETSAQITNFILSSIQENGLDMKQLSSFSADIAPVNFGGSQHSGKNNVFSRLKEQTLHLIPVGCPAHILHNAAEKGSERLTLDIETIVLKIGSHFKSQTGRAMRLKHFCEELDSNYSTLPTHTPTRWTTLDAVLERMIDLWEPLKAHFLSLKHPPRILEDFFKSEESLIIVSFLHSALLLFNKPLLLLQKSNALFPELAEIIESFKIKILQRQCSGFFGATTDELLRTVDEEHAKVLKASFQEFYTITLEYINKWYRFEKHPMHINWTLLKDQAIEYEEVKGLAKQVDPLMAMKDELFDEVSAVNALLKKIPDDVFRKDEPEAKWMKIFAGNDSFPLLYKLVSIIFSLPVSNACVERVFSLVSAQWTKERNRLSEMTVKSQLQVKVNLDLSCREIHEALSNNKELLEQIVSGKKYGM